MTEKEKNKIRLQIRMLTIFLNHARAEIDEAKYDGNWNDVNYWRGRIEQTNETIDFLHELTNWKFYK